MYTLICEWDLELNSKENPIGSIQECFCNEPNKESTRQERHGRPTSRCCFLPTNMRYLFLIYLVLIITSLMNNTCYCALCSVPLRQHDVQVGSILSGDLARRRKRVDKEREARLRSTRFSDKIWQHFPGIRGYDPALLEAGWAWVEDVVCLGRNDSLPGPQRYPRAFALGFHF